MKKSNIVIIALGLLVAGVIYFFGESFVMASSATDVIANISGFTEDEDYIAYTEYRENE